ncbi:MAG: hypothetical protein GY865_04780 [candidate division Zixibacteria bacterium]|nr:hypothetical protein [candidate division Zixibacteria bacterium]
MSSMQSYYQFCIYHLLIISLLIITIFANISYSTGLFDESIDADTLGPSQIHQIMGQKKAEALGQSRSATVDMEPYRYNQTEFDVNFYVVEITVDVPTEEITGTVTTEATSLTTDLQFIEIDLASVLTVDNIRSSDGVDLNYTRSSDRILIELSEILQPDDWFAFIIDYHGHPEAAGLDGFNFSSNDGYPIVSSLSEPYMSRTWWPCKDRNDDKADSMDIYITCATNLFCASNGTLIDTTQNGDGTWTFNYQVRYPIVTYLFSVAISEYAIWTDWYHYSPTDSMPIVNHVYPDHLAYSKLSDHWGATPYILEVFSDLFGEYPFINEKYGHANFQWGGGMEHQTCTSMGGSAFGFSEPVVAHEAAHQWWGDMITCRSWHDIWLNEGFASYSEALYYEVKDGVDEYHSYMLDMAQGGGSYAGPIYVYDTTSVGNIFSLIVYDKGACVLHMLRHVVGDATFFDIIQAYYNGVHQHADVTTEQFKNLCETVSGMELDYFFDQWIYGTFRPEYKYSYHSEIDHTDGLYWTFLNIKQMQTSPPEVFTMPLDIVISYSPFVRDTFYIFNDSDDSTYAFKTEQLPIGVSLDPDNWVLKFSNQTTFFGLLPFPLENAGQYAEYEDTIIARGGFGQINYSVLYGNLPDGLGLATPTGIIDGTPTEFGDFSFRVEARDALSSYRDTLDYELTVIEYEGLPGDVDLNIEVDILDIIFVVNYLYKDGTDPLKPQLADPNNDCVIDILDAVYLIDFIYKNGDDPVIGCATI